MFSLNGALRVHSQHKSQQTIFDFDFRDLSPLTFSNANFYVTTTCKSNLEQICVEALLNLSPQHYLLQLSPSIG